MAMENRQFTVLQANMKRIAISGVLMTGNHT